MTRVDGALCLALLLIPVWAGCIAPQPEIVEIAFPSSVSRDGSAEIRWAVTEIEQEEATHKEVHWWTNDRAAEGSVEAGRKGEGHYHPPPDCGPSADCARGPHFVAYLRMPPGASSIYYEVHTEGKGWDATSEVWTLDVRAD